MSDESVTNIVKDIDCIQETQQHSVTIEHSWSIKDICDLIASKRPGEKIESEQFSYTGPKSAPICKHCKSRSKNAARPKLAIIPSSYSVDFELACDYLVNNSAWRLEITKSNSDLSHVNVSAVLFGIAKSEHFDHNILRTIEQLTKSEYELFVKIKFSILNDKMNEVFANDLLEIKLDLKKCLQQLALRQSEGANSSKNTFLLDHYLKENFFQIKTLLNWLNDRKSDDFCLMTEFKLYRKSLSKSSSETTRSKLKPRVSMEKCGQANRVSSLLMLDFKHAWNIKNWRDFLMPASTTHTFLNDFEISSMFSESSNSAKLLNEFGDEFDTNSQVQMQNIKFGKFTSKLFFLVQTHKNSCQADHECANTKVNFDKNKVDSLLEQVKWKLQLYPNGYSHDYANNLSLFVNFSQLSGQLGQFAPVGSRNKSFGASNGDASLEETFYDASEDYGVILLIKSLPAQCQDHTDQSQAQTERKHARKVHSCETFVKASFQICILDSHGKKVDKCQSEKQLFELFGSWGYKEYMNSADLQQMKEKYLTDSNLNLHCKIVLFYTVTTKVSTSGSTDASLVVKEDKLEIKSAHLSTSESTSSSENMETKQYSANGVSQPKPMVKHLKKKKSSASNKINDYCNTLVYDLRRMFLKAEMSNLTIQAPVRLSEQIEISQEADSNFKEFKVHKLILSSRSEVFFKMFNSDSLENGGASAINTLCIRDFDAFVVEIFLNFLYTDILEINFKDFKLNFDTCDPNLRYVSENGEETSKSSDEEASEKMAARNELCSHIFAELFKIADKYCVHRLKHLCENQLVKLINEENTVELLVISYLHSSAKLKKKCFNFLAENVSSIISQPSWTHLEKSYPGLLAETFRVLYFKNKEKATF